MRERGRREKSCLLAAVYNVLRMVECKDVALFICIVGGGGGGEGGGGEGGGGEGRGGEGGGGSSRF